MKATNTIISQAISLGFDFGQFSNENTIQNIQDLLSDFFNENADFLPQIDDECEVISNGRSQYVEHGDYWCQGEIVDYSKHWHKSPETKIYHSSFIMEKDGQMVNMRLYYLVGQTDFNQNI